MINSIDFLRPEIRFTVKNKPQTLEKSFSSLKEAENFQKSQKRPLSWTLFRQEYEMFPIPSGEKPFTALLVAEEAISE